MKALWRFLTSLKTCAVAGLAFCAAGAAGSVLLSRHPELFGDMDAQVFARWFAAKGLSAPGPCLWLYGLLSATAVTAVNAACCTAERIAQIVRAQAGWRRLLPHVMHIGFLGVVLCHLVSAVSGDRVPGLAVQERGFAPVRGTPWILALDRLDVVTAPEGYPRDFSAGVTLYEGMRAVAQGVVRTNEPLFFGGYGIYLRDFGTTPWGLRFAVFDANSDPGAGAVLVFAGLFTAANALYLVPSRKRDAGP